MPGRLILLCGLPASGKTTLARRLERELPAIRLCPDEWMTALGFQLSNQTLRASLEQQLTALAHTLLSLGNTVILENGFWTRADRDEQRLAARALGAAVELQHLRAPVDELWRRAEIRRRESDGIALTRGQLEQWASVFEAPDAHERALYDPAERMLRR